MISKSISVVVPAYNEEKNIASVIETVHAFLKKNFTEFEIIVVDDGSTDRTVETLGVLKGIPFKILHNGTNQGKGFSIKQGVAAAQKDLILISDADLSTPLEEVFKLIKDIEKEYDIVIGSRALRDAQVLVRQGFTRRTMGKIFNLFVRFLLFRGIKDTQCGFKCFKKEAAKKIFACQRIRRFSFDVEVLYIARRQGFKIKEVGVKWFNRADSRVVVWRDPLNMFADLFRIRINGLRGHYDAC